MLIHSGCIGCSMFSLYLYVSYKKYVMYWVVAIACMLSFKFVHAYSMPCRWPIMN